MRVKLGLVVAIVLLTGCSSTPNDISTTVANSSLGGNQYVSTTSVVVGEDWNVISGKSLKFTGDITLSPYSSGKEKDVSKSVIRGLVDTTSTMTGLNKGTVDITVKSASGDISTSSLFKGKDGEKVSVKDVLGQ